MKNKLRDATRVRYKTKQLCYAFICRAAPFSPPAIALMEEAMLVAWLVLGLRVPQVKKT